MQDDEWSLKLEFMGSNNKVKCEYVTVDTAFVKRQYGPVYSKYVRLLPQQIEKNIGLFQKKTLKSC